MCKISIAFLMLFVMSSGVTTIQAEAARAKNFGIEWVGKHPFTIMALTQRPGALADDKYTKAGFGTMLAWKNRPGLFAAAVRLGIPWHFHTGRRPLTDELKSQIKHLYETYPGGKGFLIWDEPKRPEMKTISEVASWIKKSFPDVIVYSNAYPIGAPPGKYYGGRWISSGVYEEPPVPYSYDHYLDDFVRIIRPDVLMVDIYPYKVPPEGVEAEYLREKYFKNLTAIRRAALKAGLPYWIFVQAYEKEGGGARRYPSESDLRMQVFVSLAYGFTGIAYFTFDHVFKRALLEGETQHKPTYLYYDAIKVNAEAMNLGQTLRFLRSTGVWYIPGNHVANDRTLQNPAPEGLKAYSPGSDGVEKIRGVSLNSNGLDVNGLVGFFKDDEGSDYFMLVNLRHGAGARAADVKLTMTMELDPSLKSVTRLSRESGATELLPIRNGRLTITLPGGTGDLFKIAGGRFPRVRAGG